MREAPGHDSQKKDKGPFLTPAECDKLARTMETKYAAFLKDRRLEIEVEREIAGVYAKVTLRNASSSFFYPVEGRIRHDAHELSARDAALFLLDYIDAYFDEYLSEGGEVYLPIDWADYECDGVPLQLRGQILNLEVEKLADQWLAGTVRELPEGMRKH